MQERIAQQQWVNAKFYEMRRFEAAKIYYEQLVEKYPGSGAATDARAWLEAHQGIVHIGSPKADVVTVQ